MKATTLISKRLLAGEPNETDREWLAMLWDALEGIDVSKLLKSSSKFAELNALVALHPRFKHG